MTEEQSITARILMKDKMGIGLKHSRRRSFSDSADCDDELAQLMSLSKPNVFRQTMSDEDTEDASEDGGDTRRSTPNELDDTIPMQTIEIKEQVYQDKMALLKEQLVQLKNETHPEYLRGLRKIMNAYTDRIEINQCYEELVKNQIEHEFMKEKKAALREFEEKKIELKDVLLSELRDRRKQIEVDRTTFDLCSDNTEVKTISTRKLRRRPNEPPAPNTDKRRKAGQNHVSFLLDEKIIEDDLISILNAKANAPTKISAHSQQYQQDTLSASSSAPTTGTISGVQRSKSKSPSPPTNISDIKIEDGKLFYERRWFHRGQQIYLDCKDSTNTSGIISAISQEAVWIRKASDSTKIRVTLSQLIRGKYILKRRA